MEQYLDLNAPVIVVAMPSELRHALECADYSRAFCAGPWPAWTCEFDGNRANFVLSGIGMVNSGASLARYLSDFQPSVVLNYGCAGAHRPEIRPGDVIVGERYVHHRALAILPDGFERHLGTAIDPQDSARFVPGFEADSRLLDTAREIAEEFDPTPWPGRPDRTPAILFGPIASADTWAQSTELIDRIHREHGTLCEDMEAAALAQICEMHRLPFLAIKDISNNEFESVTDHGSAGPTLEPVMDEVGRRAFEVIRALLGRL